MVSLCIFPDAIMYANIDMSCVRSMVCMFLNVDIKSCILLSRHLNRGNGFVVLDLRCVLSVVAGTTDLNSNAHGIGKWSEYVYTVKLPLADHYQ